ncbi:hypothetical protein Mal64_29720 [Pseudobythopirellula maris]|uniref:EF-hand domain-containing protein n=1 Tax=Pseudobythopirellula maris TaxID=2527991 RepID=A0A5C5ZLX1_9BACT|nr:BBP7 family outer membrane beta-barrel protein [Pseudobythopirellula maris]TWT87433.1 hypothetical protein Mal64_29720 [Pseudobythopirellula maris]
MSATPYHILLAHVVRAFVALAAVATPSACLAQAYGARDVAYHHDLRWFEPIELDLDGQMPRKDAGYFASIEKTFWGTLSDRVEIGDEGLLVDSETMYQPATIDLAITALEQNSSLGHIDSLSENLSYSGLSFAVIQANDPSVQYDDIEVMPFDTSGFVTVAQLQAEINTFNTNPANIAAGLSVKVDGAIQPYAVRNSILDAMPDAGFSWGERYEFGFSDGENGWMVGIIDGPETEAGGTWGAGGGQPLQDPDYIGPNADTFALGFGSVAVNFRLPNEDFLKGFRDYQNNNNGAAEGTVYGPLLYVGNYGANFDDNDPFNTDNAAGLITANVDQGLLALGRFDEAQTDPPNANPDVVLLDALINVIVGDVQNALTTINGLEDEDQVGFVPTVNDVLADLAALQAQFTTLQNDPPPGEIPPNMLDTQIDNLTVSLTALDLLLSTIVLEEEGDGGDGENTAIDADRLADDIDGDGNPGVVRVLADIDGDGVINPDEVIALLTDFGDLTTFNVFFDTVTARTRTKMDSVELVKTLDIDTGHKMERGRNQALRLSYGVRFMDIEDEFFMQGEGSIFGRTTVNTDVENQILGPQLGLRWTQHDGAWDWILDARGMLGYNIVDFDQYGLFGEEAIPGALNRSASARTTASVQGKTMHEFSPIGELRAELRYRLSKSISVKAGYTAHYVGNVHRGGNSTDFAVPYFGFKEDRTDLFTNGLNFGVEFKH